VGPELLRREKRSDTVAQADRAERRVELGQCWNSELFGEFLDGRHGGLHRARTLATRSLAAFGSAANFGPEL
jgi:hypothetical protein